jgi:hypothetical protein
MNVIKNYTIKFFCSQKDKLTQSIINPNLNVIIMNL